MQGININIWALLIAAASALVLGAIWYSKFLFGKVWCREEGMNINEGQCKKGHGAVRFIVAFLLSLLAATGFTIFLGPTPILAFSVLAGVITGFCWVATSFGINYLFANRSIKLFLIDAGYHVIQFTLYGLIFGLWH